MASLKVHLQKALSARAQAIAAHRASLDRQASITTTAAKLAAGAAAAAKLPANKTAPPAQKGSPQ